MFRRRETKEYVNEQNAILWGTFDGFTWIRCEGKGSFLQSPALKDCAQSAEKDGQKHFVIDLEACTGMDSTFMGTLAGLSTRLRRTGGGVQIATPGAKNRQSLEDLGLDHLLEIEPLGAGWRGKVDEIRSSLKPYAPKAAQAMGERARHVFDAHRDLASTSQANAERFRNVLDVLKKQVPPDSQADPK
ncbi:anti-anti-sigma regulatory factor [Haloferula luteola]|uniref:Anti-anti-sigma regulatory factor n=1 Tax=Haloferula luteola TaxID=595692 RepID=A0A840V4F8_9BACT|nr:anti-anti-sigma regulatory factor [Haloferula luteola]